MTVLSTPSAEATFGLAGQARSSGAHTREGFTSTSSDPRVLKSEHGEWAVSHMRRL